MPGLWKRNRGLRIAVKSLLALVAVIVLLVIGGIAYLLSPSFNSHLSDYASEKSGRKIDLGRKIEVNWGKEPKFTFREMKIGNPEWAGDPMMFSAERLTFSVKLVDLLKFRLTLPELEFDTPHLWLEKDKDGQANWDFSKNPAGAVATAPAPDNRFEFPVIDSLVIKDGTMVYRDAKKNIDTELQISTAEGETGESQRIIVTSKGKMQKQPFTLDLKAASILQLRQSHDPYPFKLKTRVGATEASAEGTIDDPVKFQGLNVKLDLKGANAADLFPLTGVVLPTTPPYHIAGHLTFNNDIWVFEDFSGTMGNSDLRGDLEFRGKEKPPYLKGKFVSKSLDMKDLAGFIGADKEPAAGDDRVIPDRPLAVERFGAMNADVEFRASHIKTTELLEDVNAKVQLKNSVLTLRPLSFGMAGGKINADIRIDATKKDMPAMDAEVNFSRLSLEKIFQKLADKFGEENVTAGLLGGKVKLKGSGKSVRTILADSNGSIGIGMEGGRLSNLLLELIGLDIYKATGLVLAGDKPVAINCVVGDMDVESGIAKTRTLLVDTDVTTIQSEGEVNLKNENIDMRVTAHPKKPSLLSARTPILVRGKLKKPSVGIDPVAAAARGGAAAALGVLLTPVAALLAFLEPGLGEDSQCASFVRDLDKKTGGQIPKQEKGAAAPAH